MKTMRLDSCFIINIILILINLTKNSTVSNFGNWFSGRYGFKLVLIFETREMRTFAEIDVAILNYYLIKTNIRILAFKPTGKQSVAAPHDAVDSWHSKKIPCHSDTLVVDT